MNKAHRLAKAIDCPLVENLVEAATLLRQQDEALRMALEALESKYIVGCGAWQHQQNLAIAKIKEVLND